MGKPSAFVEGEQSDLWKESKRNGKRKSFQPIKREREKERVQTFHQNKMVPRVKK